MVLNNHYWYAGSLMLSHHRDQEDNVYQCVSRTQRLLNQVLELITCIVAGISFVLCQLQHLITLSNEHASEKIELNSRARQHWRQARRKTGIHGLVLITMMLLSSSLASGVQSTGQSIPNAINIPQNLALSAADSIYIANTVTRKATVVQAISGISYSTYSSSSNYNTALKNSIAACMTGLSASDIVDLVVASRTSSAALRKKQMTAASDSISVTYDISSSSSSVTYTSLVSELTTAMTDSTFISYLTNYSVIYSAPGFANCTATLESTTDIIDTTGLTDDHVPRPFPKDAVAGLVILGMIVLCCVCVVSIYCCTKHTEAPRPTRVYAVAPAPAVLVVCRDVEMEKLAQPEVRVKAVPAPITVSRAAGGYETLQEEV